MSAANRVCCDSPTSGFSLDMNTLGGTVLLRPSSPTCIRHQQTTLWRSALNDTLSSRCLRPLDQRLPRLFQLGLQYLIERPQKHWPINRDVSIALFH